jgi:branched-chain amino acid transport system ATP-binding protein
MEPPTLSRSCPRGSGRASRIVSVGGVVEALGGLQALSDVGITITRGQIYGLIGPNGAGKTTFFNVLTGLYMPDSGAFELGGKPYKPSAVHEVAKAGIAAPSRTSASSPT